MKHDNKFIEYRLRSELIYRVSFLLSMQAYSHSGHHEWNLINQYMKLLTWMGRHYKCKDGEGEKCI